MNQPHTLFVYGKVRFESRWHLKCVNCGPTSENDWDWPLTCQLTFSSGCSVNVTLPPRDFDTGHVSREPSEIYEVHPIIRALQSSASIYALLAHQGVVVITDEDLSQINLPQFLSIERSSCHRVELVIRFESPFLENLPEIQAYEEELRENSATDPYLNMFAQQKPTNTRIPLGLYFPATFVASGTEYPVVYLIKKWCGDEEAVVECFTSPFAEVGAGTMLTSHAVDSRLVSIGRVMSKVETG